MIGQHLSKAFSTVLDQLHTARPRNACLAGIVAASVLSTLPGCTDSKPQASASPSMSATAPAVVPSSPPSSSASQTPIAQTSIAPDATGNVSLENGRITFVLPPGFTQMTAEEIALKFPRTGNPPKYAYGNERRNVAIAVSFTPANVTPQQLPQLKTALRQTIGKALPNLQWINDEMTTINNTPFAHLEFVSQAIDTKIHNDAYFTSFDGKAIGFNFNATVAQYDAAQSELRKTRDSITIR